MLKIKNPFRPNTDPRILRRLDSIKVQSAEEIVETLERLLREERQAREEREIGLISFGRFAPRLRDTIVVR